LSEKKLVPINSTTWPTFDHRVIAHELTHASDACMCMLMWMSLASKRQSAFSTYKNL